MAVITAQSPDLDDVGCPDCRWHKVGDHDMYGCTYKDCGCTLTREFLRDYLEDVADKTTP
jgi:hypothetical protein